MNLTKGFFMNTPLLLFATRHAQHYHFFIEDVKSVSPTRAQLIFACLYEHIPIGCDHVSDAVEWEHESHPDKLESLGENVHPAPSRQTLA